MNDVTVTEIINDKAKEGHSEKTGKDWSMSRVGLSNGESVFIFNPIAVGDVVESKQNGQYINWSKKRVSIEDRVASLEARVAALEGDLVPGTASAIKPADEAPKSLTERYREAKAAVKQDTVDENVEQVDDDDFMKSIPF